MFTYSQFYRRHEMASRWGIKAAGGSIAGAFGGLLGSGLGNLPKSGMFERWRWIFLVEGLLTVVLSAFVYWLMPNSVNSASFLSAEERQVAVKRIDEENKMHVGGEDQSPWRLAVLKKALWNANTQLVSLGIMMSLLSLASLSLFMVSLGFDAYCYITSFFTNVLNSRPCSNQWATPRQMLNFLLCRLTCSPLAFALPHHSLPTISEPAVLSCSC